MDLQLKQGEVHVWSAALGRPAMLARLLTQLANDERERAERLRVREDFARFVVSRALLRTILGRYLDVEPREIRFSTTPNGKPVLANPYENALTFNLSRSRELVLYAIASDVEVGIDVEREGQDLEVDQLAERFFSPAEAASIRRLNPSEKSTAFLTYWVCKEAYVKATGEGLSRPLNSFEVSFTGKPELIDSEAGPQESCRWSLHRIRGLAGHIAAFVADKNCSQVRQREWLEPV